MVDRSLRTLGALRASTLGAGLLLSVQLTGCANSHGARVSPAGTAGAASPAGAGAIPPMPAAMPPATPAAMPPATAADAPPTARAGSAGSADEPARAVNDCASFGVDSLELDVSTCEQRAVEPCVAAVSERAQVDAMLAAELEAISPGFIEFLNEDTLVVQFEHGCPRRARASFIRNIPEQRQLFSDRMRAVRWSCAERTPCGTVVGPSTLATP